MYLNRNLDANKEKGKYYGIVMDILVQIMIRENIVVTVDLNYTPVSKSQMNIAILHLFYIPTHLSM